MEQFIGDLLEPVFIIEVEAGESGVDIRVFSAMHENAGRFDPFFLQDIEEV
jgi:hypothetical protein